MLRRATPYNDFSQINADLNQCLSIVDNHLLLFSEPNIEEAWEEALSLIIEQYGDSPETQLRCDLLTELFISTYLSSISKKC